MGTFLLLWLTFLLILFSAYAVASANDRRLEQVERERQRIASDAIRVKAALDQEAFRAASPICGCRPLGR